MNAVDYFFLDQIIQQEHNNHFNEQQIDKSGKDISP